MLRLFFFGSCLALHTAYWLRMRNGVRRAEAQTARTVREAPATPPPISVVVAARNEAHRLHHLFGALDQQTHPQFEVVLVDDGSTDGTADLIETWAAERPHVRLVRADPQQAPGKKRALTLGIEAASHDLLALTDADCAPRPGWLTTLARLHAAAPEPTVLVGYAPYHARRDLLGRVAAYETFVTGFLTAAAIGFDQAYMAVGRNLSYPKALFRRLGGFGRFAHLISGDDDLFVQEAVRQENARVLHVFGAETFAPSAAPTAWRAWLRQKRRHLSDGRVYPLAIQAHLALFHGSGLLLWLAPLVAGWPGAALLLGRFAVQFGALREAAHTLGERDLIGLQPVLDVFYTLYNLILAPLSLARDLKRW